MTSSVWVRGQVCTIQVGRQGVVPRTLTLLLEFDLQYPKSAIQAAFDATLDDVHQEPAAAWSWGTPDRKWHVYDLVRSGTSLPEQARIEAENRNNALLDYEKDDEYWQNDCVTAISGSGTVTEKGYDRLLRLYQQAEEIIRQFTPHEDNNQPS